MMPCHPARARQLLNKGRARVHKLFPFTLRLIDRSVEDSILQPMEIAIDPGSRFTGIAVARRNAHARFVLFLAEIQHRGLAIREALTARSSFRRRRRSANLRYRAPRFLNRTRRPGWLAPSIESRVANVVNWTRRLAKLAPITAISGEQVRFDTQFLESPEVSGALYQQGTLAGYEVREYLLEKWQRACAYCGESGVPLQIEHIHPKAKGGSSRVSNLTLACESCNQAKGTRDIAEFLVHNPKQLARILAQAKRPLSDAAAVNITRKALFERLREFGIPVNTWSGGRTKFNRTRLGLPKDHALDAACVGEIIAVVGWNRQVVTIMAKGRGAYQRTQVDRFGFPRGFFMRTKQVRGFATGDMVQAVVPTGKKAGTHCGRVAIRATGCFNIQTKSGVVQGVSWKYCHLLQRADGYAYGRKFNDLTKKGDISSSA